MTEIKRRRQQIEEVRQGLRPEYQEHFDEADAKLGWSNDWVVTEDDGSEVHTSNKKWARIIANGGIPTASNGKRRR